MPEGDLRQAERSGAAPPSPEIDWWGLLSDPEFLASPYAALKRIREQGAIHRDPASGVYFVLGYDAFRRLAAAPEMGRDTRLWTDGWSSPENRRRDPLSYELFSAFQPQMTNANPPDHRRMRAVYEKAFRRDSLTALLPMIEAECRRLLEALPPDRPVDFMAAVADPLASLVSRKAFGIPAEMDERLARWVEALSLIGNVMMSAEQKLNARTALLEFKAYLRGRLASRVDEGDEGFLGLGLAALADGTMDEEESLNNLVTLIAGGRAIAALLGNGLLALLRHPAQLERLRTERDLVRPAVEEMLRYEPGGSFILRVAIQDFECAGVRIPAGSLAIGLVAAINRDPARFEHPDAFDVGRQPNPHMVFGGGPHICIGKALVRMTAEVAFAALIDRFERIELAGEPVWWTHRSDQHGLHSLPLRLGRA